MGRGSTTPTCEADVCGHAQRTCPCEAWSTSFLIRRQSKYCHCQSEQHWRARVCWGRGRPENLKFTKGEDLVKTRSELAPATSAGNCGSRIYDDLGEVTS